MTLGMGLQSSRGSPHYAGTLEETGFCAHGPSTGPPSVHLAPCVARLALSNQWTYHGRILSPEVHGVGTWTANGLTGDGPRGLLSECLVHGDESGSCAGQDRPAEGGQEAGEGLRLLDQGAAARHRGEGEAVPTVEDAR